MWKPVKTVAGFLAAVCVACAYVSAAESGEAVPRKLRDGEVLMDVPEVIRNDLNNKAVWFLRAVYPDLSPEWIDETYTNRFMQERYIVYGFGTNPGPRVSFGSEPIVGLPLPYGDSVGLSTTGVPQGVRLPKQDKPLTLKEAQEIAESVLGRLLGESEDSVRMNLERSGERKTDHAYYFAWREDRKEPFQFAGKYVYITIRSADGLVLRARIKEALPAPKIPFEAIVKEAKSKIENFQEKYLHLSRRCNGCRRTLVWEYVVPPPPMGQPEDFTWWDATTGVLLYSVVLKGGTREKPYRDKAFYAEMDLEQMENQLKDILRLRALELSKDTTE